MLIHANNSVDILGMSETAADILLKRNMIYVLLKKAKLHMCHVCGEPILRETDLSMQHRRNWRTSQEPLKEYLDFDNIEFTHKFCHTQSSNQEPTQKTYMGVTFRPDKPNGKQYAVRVKSKDKKVFLGFYATDMEAAFAHDVAYVLIHDMMYERQKPHSIVKKERIPKDIRDTITRNIKNRLEHFVG